MAGEKLFDDYWANFGKMKIKNKNGEYVKLSSFYDYLSYRGLPLSLNNPKKAKGKDNMAEKIFVPPIKIQGIKTKIVPMIKQNIIMNEKTLWLEPFMGSGVVGFNVRPRKAIFADINPVIIDFYNGIKNKEITSIKVRAFLEKNGALLQEKDGEFYYEMREYFNETRDPLYFLFLNRSCFNGMIRYNKNYEFNVPYGHKPFRFTKAYITKIVNQIKYVEDCMELYDWQFVCQSFEKTIALYDNNSFIYCDPPYIGRHVDYYDSWDEETERKLCDILKKSGVNFMLSTWDHNAYRTNEYINSVWGFCNKLTKEHFYHVGAKESNRNSITEALLMNYEPIAV